MKTQEVNLKLDWCNYKMAKYACENWHYSRTMPAGKLTKVGVWENQRFIGVILFGRGASNNLLKQYDLRQDQGCELVRVALNKHITTVSRIMSITIKMLKKYSPNLKLIVSFADTGQDHFGGIYQASNWIYTGLATGDTNYIINGVRMHSRSVGAKYGRKDIEFIKSIDKNAIRLEQVPKHRYLYPLDSCTRQQIIKLAKQYPKRAELESKALDFQSKENGAVPISTHQKELSNG